MGPVDHARQGWTEGYGGADNAWHYAVLPRLRGLVPAAHALEIGPAYGVWTRRLRPLCRRMTLVDESPEMLEQCRAMFGRRAMAYVLAGAEGFSGVDAGSVDLVFSWHALVHHDRDRMRALLRDVARAMREGASGIIHHSNLGELGAAAEAGPAALWHGRAPGVSARTFREDCAGVGLACTYQELVPWGSEHLIDCFSFFTRTNREVRTVVEENAGFWHRAMDAARVGRRYAPPFPDLKPRVRRTILGIPVGELLPNEKGPPSA